MRRRAAPRRVRAAATWRCKTMMIRHRIRYGLFPDTCGHPLCNDCMPDSQPIPLPADTLRRFDNNLRALVVVAVFAAAVLADALLQTFGVLHLADTAVAWIVGMVLVAVAAAGVPALLATLPPPPAAPDEE